MDRNNMDDLMHPVWKQIQAAIDNDFVISMIFSIIECSIPDEFELEIFKANDTEKEFEDRIENIIFISYNNQIDQIHLKNFKNYEEFKKVFKRISILQLKFLYYK